jgi:hypothetical protein
METEMGIFNKVDLKYTEWEDTNCIHFSQNTF